MPNVLITGFEPFAQHKVNSSWEGAVHAARSNSLCEALLLPVDYLSARAALIDKLAFQPVDILLLCGLAQGDAIRLETRARKPQAFSHFSGYHTRHGKWPWRTTTLAMQAAALPMTRSNDAGAYVCESTYWAALDYRARHKRPMLVAFLHVPPLSNVWNAPRIGDAINIALKAAHSSLIAPEANNASISSTP